MNHMLNWSRNSLQFLMASDFMVLSLIKDLLHRVNLVSTTNTVIVSTTNTVINKGPVINQAMQLSLVFCLVYIKTQLIFFIFIFSYFGHKQMVSSDGYCWPKHEYHNWLWIWLSYVTIMPTRHAAGFLLYAENRNCRLCISLFKVFIRSGFFGVFCYKILDI